MSAQTRVRRGFNRLAILIAGIAAVVSAASFSAAAYYWWIAPDMPDVAKIERNVAKMIKGNAPPWEIHGYLKAETTLPADFTLENLQTALGAKAADNRWRETQEPLVLGVAMLAIGAIAGGLISLLGWVLAGFF